MQTDDWLSCEGPGAVRTPIWDKAQAADVSAYQETVYSKPLSAFVAHMVKEGQESQHTPQYIARLKILACALRLGLRCSHHSANTILSMSKLQPGRLGP